MINMINIINKIKTNMTTQSIIHNFNVYEEDFHNHQYNINIKGVGWNDWGNSGLNELEKKLNGVEAE